MSDLPLSDNQRLRIDVGFAPDDTASLPDAQCTDAYARARALYEGEASANAAARVIVLEQLYARAVTSTDYTQNNSTEKASQLFDHYGKLLDSWKKALDAAIAEDAANAAGGTVHSGRQVRKPARLKEFPGWGGGRW